MPVANEEHRNACLVASVNRFLVTDTSARLNDGANACLDAFVYAIAEGEECVACHNASFNGVSGVLNGLLRRPNAVGLSHTNPRRSICFPDDDCVGFGVLNDLPVEEECLHFLFGRGALGHDFHIFGSE